MYRSSRTVARVENSLVRSPWNQAGESSDGSHLAEGDATRRTCCDD